MPVTLSDRWEKVYADKGVVDRRGKILPKSREEGTREEGTMEVPGSGGIRGGGELRYRQVFEERIGFIPNLSILDLLFCEGKNAIRYIQSS
jgi:hypothetical protein